MRMHVAQYTSRVQKGVGSGTREAKHQLLVDRVVSRDGKTRETNLCTSWIDYKEILQLSATYRDTAVLEAFKRSIGH